MKMRRQPEINFDGNNDNLDIQYEDKKYNNEDNKNDNQPPDDQDFVRKNINVIIPKNGKITKVIVLQPVLFREGEGAQVSSLISIMSSGSYT